MAGGRLRAFRTYGTDANLRASLIEFSASGGGSCTTCVPGAQARIRAIGQDLGDVRAVPFDKLVAQFLTLSGSSMLPLADSVHERETLARACRKLTSESPFFACKDYPGFVRRLAATMRELRLWGLRAEELAALAERAEPWLAAKLHSLAQLDVALASGLRASARELESDRLERCLQSAIPSGAKQRIWVYTGGEFAPLWGDLLLWSMKNEIEVWIATDGHASANRLFPGAQRMLEHVGARSANFGEANGLAEGLFGDQPRLDVGLDIEICRASDPLAEVEWALRHLQEQVAAGVPWARTAVYARNLQDYAPLLESAAARFEVPLRYAHRQKLNENGWVRFLLMWLRTCTANHPGGLAELASSSYLGLDEETIGHHRASIRLAPSSESAWEDLTGRMGAENSADLWLLEAARIKGKSHLGALRMREWYDELIDIVDGPWIAAAFHPDSPTRARDEAARSALLRTLEQHTALAEASDEFIEFEQVVSDIARLAAQAEYSWKGQEDGLHVVSSAYALGGADTLCVLGMIEGCFPRRRSEDPILSDAERDAISHIRPRAPALRTSHDSARAERDELVRVCAAASRNLAFFYPQVGDDRDNTPAFYLTEIERVAPTAGSGMAISPALLAPPLEACRFDADRALRVALESEKIDPPEQVLLTAAATDAVSGLPERGLTPKELSESIRCPFQFVFKRRLNVRAGHVESKWHRLRYLPETAGLSTASDPETATRSLEAALEAELEELGSELDPSERKLLEAGGRREIRGWVDREFHSRQIWRDPDAAWTSGISFGEADTADELPVRGVRIKLRGGLAGVGDLRGFAVGQLYGGRALGQGRSLEKIEDPDLLELGVYIWSLCRRRPNVALEVDTTGGERLLMMLPKPDAFDIESRVSQGLRVVELGDKQEFYERVKGLLAEAVARIETGSIETRPDEHCRYCDYGELCRRAQGYGEQVDPFGSEGTDA